MSRVGFEYALLRVVPRIERGEFVNVGVLVYAQSRRRQPRPSRPTSTRTGCARSTPGSTSPRSRRRSTRVVAVCAGGAAGGAAAALPEGQRFRWLVAPRSTVVQPGPVHTGMTDDLAAETQRLLARLVLTEPLTEPSAQLES